MAAIGSAFLGTTGSFWGMAAASSVLGIGIGAAMTAAYSAAGSVIPAGAHGTGFGVLTTASLTGMAISPIVAGFFGATGIRVVFAVDVAIMTALAVLVRATMSEG